MGAWDPRTAEASHRERACRACFTRLQHATRLWIESLCTSAAYTAVACRSNPKHSQARWRRVLRFWEQSL